LSTLHAFLSRAFVSLCQVKRDKLWNDIVIDYASWIGSHLVELKLQKMNDQTRNVTFDNPVEFILRQSLVSICQSSNISHVDITSRFQLRVESPAIIVKRLSLMEIALHSKRFDICSCVFGRVQSLLSTSNDTSMQLSAKICEGSIAIIQWILLYDSQELLRTFLLLYDRAQFLIAANNCVVSTRDVFTERKHLVEVISTELTLLNLMLRFGSIKCLLWILANCHLQMTWKQICCMIISGKFLETVIVDIIRNYSQTDTVDASMALSQAMSLDDDCYNEDLSSRYSESDESVLSICCRKGLVGLVELMLSSINEESIFQDALCVSVASGHAAVTQVLARHCFCERLNEALRKLTYFIERYLLRRSRTM